MAAGLLRQKGWVGFGADCFLAQTRCFWHLRGFFSGGVPLLVIIRAGIPTKCRIATAQWAPASTWLFFLALVYQCCWQWWILGDKGTCKCFATVRVAFWTDWWVLLLKKQYVYRESTVRLGSIRFCVLHSVLISIFFARQLFLAHLGIDTCTS